MQRFSLEALRDDINNAWESHDKAPNLTVFGKNLSEMK